MLLCLDGDSRFICLVKLEINAWLMTWMAFNSSELVIQSSCMSQFICLSFFVSDSNHYCESNNIFSAEYVWMMNEWDDAWMKCFNPSVTNAQYASIMVGYRYACMIFTSLFVADAWISLCVADIGMDDDGRTYLMVNVCH